MEPEELQALDGMTPEQLREHLVQAVAAARQERNTVTGERDSAVTERDAFRTERDNAARERDEARQAADQRRTEERTQERTPEQMTEAERAAQERAQALETERDTVAQEREAERTRAESATQRANRLALEMYSLDAATELNVTLDQAALRDAIAVGGLSSVQFNEAGEPQGVKDALATLVKAKPYIVRRATAPNLGGQNNGRGDALSTPEAQRAARNMTRGF